MLQKVGTVDYEPVPSLDANRYATKKTIAQGMLDVALLTANASQLKYVLQMGADKHPFYTLMLSLIIISIILQVLAGITMILLVPMNLNQKQNKTTLLILNHLSLAFSFGTMFIDLIKMVFTYDTIFVYIQPQQLNVYQNISSVTQSTSTFPTKAFQ